MNICFATDKNYIMPLTVAILSLLKHNKNEKFDIYLLHNGIDDGGTNELKAMCKSHGSELNSIKIDNEAVKGFHTKNHISEAAYYRLLMGNFIPKNIEKILYLDGDIVVNGPIRDLYKTDLKNNVIGAIENPGFNWHETLGMKASSRYFNSGVLLINLNSWKKQKIGERTLDYISANKQHLMTHDQCATNAVVEGNWMRLPPKYNMQTSFFNGNNVHGYSAQEVTDGLSNPVVIHYTGSSKPWSFGNKHPFKKLFWEHLRQSSYKDYKCKDINLKNAIKLILPKSLAGFFISIKKHLGR